MNSRLYKKFKEQTVPALQTEFGYKNVMQVPKVKKVVVNVGYGRFVKEGAYIENVTKTLRAITGQNPLHNKVTTSISNFKVREGQAVGASVTLRGLRMYDFLDKLINVTLPRVKDFHGISRDAFDGQGNYSLGFKEQLAFPEITSDAVEKTHGLQVIINTSAKNKAEGLALLSQLGFPFKEDKKKK